MFADSNAATALTEADIVIPAAGHGATEIRNRVEPTETANGYTGDEYCTVCNELVKRGTVIPATASSETTPPQTSDNSIFALCVFLLFVSGGAGILITVCGRKKNAV